MTASSGPQPLAIRRLVRDSAGNTRIMLVDAYTYQPVTDPTGYKVVDVQDVPEQVPSVSTPDAEKPVAKPKDTQVADERGGSEFAGSLGRDANQSPGFNNPSRNVSTSTPSRAHPGAFPSAPSSNTGPTTRAPAPPSAPSAPAPSTPSAPSQSNNPPGYSQPSFGGTQDAASTPSAPASSTSGMAPTGPNDMNNNGAYGADTGYGWGGTNSTSNWGGYGSASPSSTPASSVSGQGFGTPAGMSNTVDGSSFGGYSSQSGNNNGRGANAYFSNSGPAIGNEPSSPSPSQSSYGSMYGNGVGYGGGYNPSNTISDAGTPQSASERAAVDPSQNSPASNAARGMVARTPAEKSQIGLAIAGEVTGKTLADLSSPDPDTRNAARQQVADIQATMENRAAFNTIDQSVVPGQYDSLDTGKNLQTSKNNFAKYNAALMQTVDDFYTGQNVPTNYGVTNYANTKPFPGYTPPGWLSKLQNPAVVGPFTFGTDPMYGNVANMNQLAQANYSATMADNNYAGGYAASHDYGPDTGWGSFGNGGQAKAGYNNVGGNAGWSGVAGPDAGWGGFAGGPAPGSDGGWGNGGYSSGGYGSGGFGSDSSGGGYSGNGNGRGSSGSGYGGSGDSGFGGGGGYSSNSGNGNGRGPSGSGYGGGGYGGQSDSGGYGGNGDAGYGGDGSDNGGYGGGGYGGENGDTGGGGAGTRSNGNGGYGGL